MLKRLLLYIPLFLVFAFLFLGPVGALFGLMSPSGRDYRLDDVRIDMVLSEDSILDVSEEINYRFKGCYREVYRELPLPRQEGAGPYLMSVSAACEPDCEVVDRSYEIAGSFGEICDQQASFFVEERFANAVVRGDDTTVLYYKFWGEEWEKPAAVNGEIRLPVTPEKVYFNPPGIVDYEVLGNVISFSSKRTPGYIETRIIMPRDAFTGYIEEAGLSRDDIVWRQRTDSIGYGVLQAGYYLFLAGLMTAVVGIPILLYRKHGREPETGYRGIFEREPVYGVKPYIVNSLMSRATGDTDDNGIVATILDLARRKHIVLDEKPVKGLFSTKRELVMRFQKGRDKLSPPELKIYNFLSRMGTGGELVWKDLLRKLRGEHAARSFLATKQSFEDEVDQEMKKQYFDPKGNTLLKIFAAISAIVLAIGLITSYGMSDSHPFMSTFPLFFVPLFPLCIVYLLLPRTVFGRFTERGREIYLRSMAYKRFMTDLTQLKRYPPASLAIWEEHLVYATLFGVADKVLKNMQLAAGNIETSNLRHVATSARLSSLGRLSGVSPPSSGSSGSSFSGGGSSGGGFGGGGGGAR